MRDITKSIWVKPEIRQAFENKITECIEKVKPFTDKVIERPTLVFRQCGRAAGKCTFRFGKGYIIINSDMLTPQERYDEQLENTLPHEMGHYIDHVIHGFFNGHGREWKRVMGWMGANAERCHNMSMEGVKTKYSNQPIFHYSCNCGTDYHKLSSIRHKRTQMGDHRRCRRCGVRITYTGRITAPINGKFTLPQVNVHPQPVKVTPTPQPVKVEEPKSRVVTMFINGMLVNVKKPI